MSSTMSRVAERIQEPIQNLRRVIPTKKIKHRVQSWYNKGTEDVIRFFQRLKRAYEQSHFFETLFIEYPKSIGNSVKTRFQSLF